MHQTSNSGGGSQEDYLYMMKNPSFVPDEISGYPIYHSGMENNTSFVNYYNYKSLLNSRNNRETHSNNMSIQGSLEADLGKLWKPLEGLRVKLTYSRNISNNEENRLKMENTVYRVINRGGSGNHLYITDPTAIIGGPNAVYNETTLEGFPYTSFDNLNERVLNSGQQSLLSRDMSRTNSYQVNLMVSYARKFGKHDVSATFSIEKGESETETLYGEGTHPLPFTDGQSASLAADSQKDTNWGRAESGNLAYIGRLNYAYADRYLYPGMLIYEDIRGSKIEGTDTYQEKDGKIDENDMVQISKRKDNPFHGTLNLNFVYKSFSLNATFTAEWGAYRMMPAMYQESFSKMETQNVSAMWNDMFIYDDVYDAQGNVIAYANRNGRWPNFGYTSEGINSKQSTFWKMSATEIYLRNITLAYTLPKKWVRYVHLNNVRLNVTVQNAFSLYNACPEGYWNNFAGNYGSYPVTRKFTIGLNVTF